MQIRILASAFLLTLLCSCGFRPVYDNEDISSKLAQIEIGRLEYLSKIPTLQALTLKSSLETEFNWAYVNASKKYVLDLSYEIYMEPAGIQSNTLATRTNVRVLINYTLRDKANGKELDSDKLMQIASVDVEPSPYSNYIAKEKTATNIIKSLSTTLKYRLIGIMP